VENGAERRCGKTERKLRVINFSFLQFHIGFFGETVDSGQFAGGVATKFSSKFPARIPAGFSPGLAALPLLGRTEGGIQSFLRTEINSCYILEVLRHILAGLARLPGWEWAGCPDRNKVESC